MPKFIKFYKTNRLNNEKPVWEIINKKSEDVLGLIFYNPRWKKYVFTQWSESIIFDSSCLNDIAKFMDNIKE